MFNFDDILRGYTIEQYSEAIVETLVQFLISKNLISKEEVKKYFKDNFSETLNLIIERDKKEAKKKFEEYKDKEVK